MNLKDVLRWAAILPVAVIAPILCCILLMALVLIGDLLSGEFWLYLRHPEIIPIDHFFLSFILFAVFGYVFVYAGASISPRHKRIVAFVLFAIVAILFGFIIIFSLLVTDFADTWKILINSIICIIAAGTCSFSFEKHDDTISNIPKTHKNSNKNEKKLSRKSKSKIKIGLVNRICLSIPFVRHAMTRRTMQEHVRDLDLLNQVNRWVSYMQAPSIVNLYNEGRIDIGTISSIEYHKHVITKVFGKKAKDIASQLKLEKANIKSNPNVLVYLLNIPSSMDVGQNDIVAFVVDSGGKAYCYNWEWSLQNTKMICAWQDEKHLNFGMCNDKVEFVKTVIDLSKEEKDKQR